MERAMYEYRRMPPGQRARIVAERKPAEEERLQRAGKMEALGTLAGGGALTRTLVELHGGEIRAESDGIGKGAVFQVRLPAASSKMTEEGLDG
jgi:K+-sensing histidine kinase KdpD